MSKIDLQNTPLKQLILKLSIPSIMGMMVVSLNTLIDAFYISHFESQEAFAAISILFPFTLIINSITVCIAAGSASLLSRSLGSKDVNTQKKILPNIRSISIVSAFILFIVCQLFAEELVDSLGAKDTVALYAISYLKVYSTGFFFSIFGLAANGLIRAEGHIKEAMRYTMLSVIINVVCTPILMEVLKLGIVGAALSSVLAMGVYAIATSLYLLSKKSQFPSGKFFQFNINKPILWEILKIGFSSSLIQLSNTVKYFFLFQVLTTLGTVTDITLFSGVLRVFTFMAIPILGFLQPLQPIVGVNYGAKNYDKIHKAFALFTKGGIVFAIVLLIPVLFFTEWMLKIVVNQTIPDIATLWKIRVVFLVLLILPIGSSAIILFQSLGKAKEASILPLLRPIVLFLPLLWVFKHFYGIDGLYYVLIAENTLYAIFAWRLVLSVKKKIKLPILKSKIA